MVGGMNNWKPPMDDGNMLQTGIVFLVVLFCVFALGWLCYGELWQWRRIMDGKPLKGHLPWGTKTITAISVTLAVLTFAYLLFRFLRDHLGTAVG